MRPAVKSEPATVRTMRAAVQEAGSPAPGVAQTGALVPLGELHYSTNPRRATPPAVPSTPVIQRVRAVSKDEERRLETVYLTLDGFEDVLSFSSSIPPRLPREFFPLYDRAERTYGAILDSQEVEDDESIGQLERMVATLEDMMNVAKRQAAEDRAAQVRGMDRPPSKTSIYMPDNEKSKAMESAQALNVHLDGLAQFERNLALLRRDPGTTFFVTGKSAMGQGDTAFVVRAVSLLNSLGLRAIGVKPEVDIHSGGTSFSGTIFITPKQMRDSARAGDFIIEGPLSDPVLPPMGSEVPPSSITTAFDAMEGFVEDKRTLRNLRLYEYGTLTYRGGQLVQNPKDKTNVVHYASAPHHAFMGMGHGEMGAFYNSGSLRKVLPLEGVLADYAKTSRSSAVLLQLIDDLPGAEIYLGYANKRESVTHWVTGVCAMAPMVSDFAIVIGLYGELRHADQAPVSGALTTTYVRSKDKYSGENQEARALGGGKGRCAVVIADGVPAPVMAALQHRAMPFTLATGNYSLSEAVENNHFPIYETLDFNAGVDTAFRFQVEMALTKLKLTKTDFGAAALDLVKSGPTGLARKARSIQIVLAHPYEIRLLMGVIRANTDIRENLVARLATLL